MVVPENTGVYIKDFMFSMNLKGYELLVYALVYSFSANGERQGYWGSCEKMAERLHTTRQRVNLVLSTLVEKGLVIRTDGILNKKKVTIYQTNFKAIVIKNEPEVVIKTATTCHQNSNNLSSKRCTIIYNNISDNINSNSSSVANAPSSEFANSETAEISEDSNTSPSLNIFENSNSSIATESLSTTETKEHVPARGEAEMWASLPDLPEEPKPQPKVEKKSRTYYKAPTLTEIKEYIKANNLTHVVAESFYHKYQSQNWCVGRTKINWQDKLKEWELTNANGRFGNRKQPASPYNLDIKNQTFDEGDWK